MIADCNYKIVYTPRMAVLSLIIRYNFVQNTLLIKSITNEIKFSRFNGGKLETFIYKYIYGT